MVYWVYILRIKSKKSGTLKFYIGETMDFKRRLWQHKNGKSRYTSAYEVLGCYWRCSVRDEQDALRLETHIKRSKRITIKRLCGLEDWTKRSINAWKEQKEEYGIIDEFRERV